MAKNNKKLGDIFTPEIMEYYIGNPVKFVEDVIFNVNAKNLGGRHFITSQQKQVLHEFEKNRRLSVRSGRGIGKTALLSWLVIYFLCTRTKPRIYVTAPTSQQLRVTLWPEVAKWLSESLVKDIFTWNTKQIYLNENPAEWFAAAVTTDESERAQGWHSEHMLVLMDEASGISDDIYNVVQGSLTGNDNKIVLTGNPTKTSGFFFDSHNRFRDGWKTFVFSSLDSPLPSTDFINDYKLKYGETHSLFKVHILGEFPSGSPDSFVSLEEALKCTVREVPGKGEIQIGVDVAHMGDDMTSLAYRIGDKVFPIITKDKTTIPEVTGMVLSLVKEIRINTGSKDTIKVCVDSTGVGAGVSDELALDRDNNIEVVPVNFGSRSDDEKYEYMVSRMWGMLRDKINVISLPDDPQLIAQISNRRFRITPNGKIRVEPKSEYKKEFGESPDKADSVILCFSNAKNQQVILKTFDHLNSEMVKKIPGYLGGDKLCSVYYDKNKNISVLYTMWSGNKLYILDELKTDDSIANISNQINQRGEYYRIIGNSEMFTLHGDDVKSQFSKYGVNIYENYKYDEYGAIENLILLINSKRIIINKDCNNLVNEMRKWSFNTGKTSITIDYSLCYSLLLLISELRDKIVYSSPIQYYTPYSKEKDIDIKENVLNKSYNRNRWMLN